MAEIDYGYKEFHTPDRGWERNGWTGNRTTPVINSAGNVVRHVPTPDVIAGSVTNLYNRPSPPQPTELPFFDTNGNLVKYREKNVAVEFVSTTNKFAFITGGKKGILSPIYKVVNE